PLHGLFEVVEQGLPDLDVAGRLAAGARDRLDEQRIDQREADDCRACQYESTFPRCQPIEPALQRCGHHAPLPEMLMRPWIWSSSAFADWISAFRRPSPMTVRRIESSVSALGARICSSMTPPR